MNTPVIEVRGLVKSFGHRADGPRGQTRRADQDALGRAPTSVWTYIAARVLFAVLLSTLVVGIMIVYGILALDVPLPTATLPAYLLTMLFGAVVLSLLGVAITSAIPSTDAAAAVTNAIIFPLLFASGIFFPPEVGPAWLDTASGFFPLRPLADASIHAFFATSGSGFSGTDLLVLGAWGLGGLILAARYFSWQPRT